jgi:hypothetical protein
MFLKQSTAVTVKVGPFVDSVDGNTQETGLTISQADIRLSKNGGAFAQTNNATGATHDANGWYGIPLDATDTNTLGKLELSIHEAGALCVWRTFMVMPANVWDSLFGADALQVHVNEMTAGIITATVVADGTIDAATFAAGAINAAAIATGAIDADAIAADAGAEIAAAVWDLDATAHQTQGTFGQAVGDPGAGGASLRFLIGTPNVDLATDIATVDTNVDAIKAKTDNLPAAPAAVGDIPTAAQNAVELLATAADGTTTVAESLRLANSALGGKLSGAGTGTETVRDLADTKNRLVYTVDTDGNRSAVVRTLT